MDLYGFNWYLYGFIWYLYGFIWYLIGIYMVFIWIYLVFIWIYLVFIRIYLVFIYIYIYIWIYMKWERYKANHPLGYNGDRIGFISSSYGCVGNLGIPGKMVSRGLMG